MSERKSNPPVDVTLQMGTKDILKCKCGTTDGPRIVKTDCSVIIRCLSCGQKVERAGSLEAQASWNNLMAPIKPYDPRDKMESCKCGRASLICIQYTAFGEAEIKCPICFMGTGKYESVEAAVRAWNKLMHPVLFESFNCTRCTCGKEPKVTNSKLGWMVSCDALAGGCQNHTMRYEKRSDAVANWNDNIGNSLVRDVKDSTPKKCIESTLAAEPKSHRTSTSCIKSKTDLVNKMGCDDRQMMSAFAESLKRIPYKKPVRFLGVTMHIGASEQTVDVSTSNVDDVCASLQAIASLMRKV